MSWPAESSAEAAASSSPTALAEQDQLFVFGYECKIFRDDEKANWIEKEKHLIPWMGDSNVLIDRYDGRGALMDLRSSDVQASGLSIENLEEEDESIEILCEEERYRDLHEDQEYDESAYQEEEFKRLQIAVNGMGESATIKGDSHYSAIGYSYDANNGLSMGPEPKRFNEDIPYVQPSGLYVPPDIILPGTMKSHAIIEKTAKFIAEQGNQMEIILKTKQSSNPQFDFLGYNDTLNPYYKYLVLVIKTGEYKPTEVTIEDQYDSSSPGDENFSGSEEDCDTSYLHPSLVKKDPGTLASVPKITYKPTTTNSAYSILVSKIRGATPQEQHKIQSSTETKQVQKEETNSNAQSSTTTNVPTRQPHEMPASQDQLIIEKMANYVVKNGSAFEGLAKTKGDPRFTFLDFKHPFHWYYLNCKERFKAEHNAVVASGTFMSYNKHEGRRKATEITASNSTPGPGHTSSLPLSAAGIPIANHASIQSRPTTMSAELVSRIEEIRKKNTLFSKAKDKAPDGNPGALPCDNSISISSAFSLASATAQRILKRESKEKPVIKFSSSLGTQPTILNEPKDKDDVSSNNDSVNTSKSNSSKSCSSREKPSSSSKRKLQTTDKNGMDDIKTEEEADRKRKEERRKKAALFLERIKNNTVSSQASGLEGERKRNSTELHSDVDSLPSPMVGQQDIEETCKENEPEDGEIIERLQLPTNTCESRNGTKNSLSLDKKKSGKRSLSTSSIESSYSDIPRESSSSSSSKKKRSKRKHSKKRKKKHEKSKEKSRSHAKKSKRRRR